jgi:glutamate carboxypeptidase
MDISSHSLNPCGVREVQETFKQYLTKIGFSVDLIESDKYGPHLIADNGVPGKGILLVGHSDTAHTEGSGFTKTIIQGDKVTGPGGYDMKAGVMIAVFALEALKSSTETLSKLPIRIFIISDEEVGMPDSFSLHEAESKKSRLALVMESGRPENTIVLTRKGIATFKVSASGKSAHSGNEFWLGNNAILSLAEISCEISKLSSREDDVTLNIGVFKGGHSPTIVPDYAEIRFDVRFVSMEQFDLIYSKIEDLLKRFSESGVTLEISREIFLPPMQRLPETKNLVDSYLQSFEDMGEQGRVNENIIGGGSSASLLTFLGVPSLDALGPYGEGAHTKDEWFSISSFEFKTKVLVKWIQANANKFI